MWKHKYIFKAVGSVSVRFSSVAQSCLTLCDPIEGGPPGSLIPGILQARTLEWVAISFSNAWKWKVKAKSLSRIWLLVTPWPAAYQAPPSMGFSRQEYWSGVPLRKWQWLLGCFSPPYSEIDIVGMCLVTFKSELTAPWFWTREKEWKRIESKNNTKFG